MTTKEAIYTIERLAHTEAKWPGTEDTLAALDLALTALRPVSREQVQKVWRGEWVHKKSPYDYKIFVCKKVWKANQHTGRATDFLPCLWSRPDGRGRGDGDAEIGGVTE